MSLMTYKLFQVWLKPDYGEIPRDASAAVPLHDDGLRHRRRHLHRRRHHRLLHLHRHRGLQKVWDRKAELIGGAPDSNVSRLFLIDRGRTKSHFEQWLRSCLPGAQVEWATNQLFINWTSEKGEVLPVLLVLIKRIFPAPSEVIESGESCFYSASHVSIFFIRWMCLLTWQTKT